LDEIHKQYDVLNNNSKKIAKRFRTCIVLLFINKLKEMAGLKYTVIKSREQYRKYCNLLEVLVFSGKKGKETESEIDLLTALIKLWDLEHDRTYKLDPVELLKSFIADHQLKEPQVLQIMEIQSRRHLNDILNYKKALSRNVIRRLSEYFKVSQEAFSRPYALKVACERSYRRKRGHRKKTRSRENLLKEIGLPSSRKIRFNTVNTSVVKPS
jgi:HTH-type transcriptional regulator/antitoxin HigA